MATTPLITASDTVDTLGNWLGQSSVSGRTQSQIRLAIEAAYRDLCGSHDWSYFFARRRFATVADYSTGTIEYDNSTRIVTLTSGTWPTWAAFGTLQIDNEEYEVASYTDSTHIVLSVNSNPGANVTAGESYVLWRDTYPLPVDFQSMGTLRECAAGLFPTRVEPNEYVGSRTTRTIPSQPTEYMLMGDPNYTGSLALRFMPPPTDAVSYEYMYKRRPRQMTTWAYSTGTIAASATTVTGTGTAFTQAMIGCVIRPGTSTALPTGSYGEAPFAEQRIITGYTSATIVTIDQAFDNTVSGLKFEISDPIDLDTGAMYTAFLRRSEYELGVAMRRDDTPKLLSLAKEALIRAREDECRSFDRSSGRSFGQIVPTYFTVTENTS